MRNERNDEMRGLGKGNDGRGILGDE